MLPKVDLRTNDTKKRVIEEAKRLYLTGGYGHLSMDKISETLGLKRPTLYYHFPGGKEQLLVETIKAFITELIASWGEAVAEGQNTRSRLRNILDKVSNCPLPENKRSLLVELWELGEEVKTTIKQSYQQIFNLLAGVFEEGIAAGEIKPVEMELIIHSFLGLYDQIESLIVTKQFFSELSQIVNQFELKDLIDKMFEMWLDGMGVSAA